MPGAAVTPPTWTMSITESWPLAFNFSPRMATGQTIASVTCTLVRLDNAKSIALTGSPIITGSNVVQHVDGPTELVKPGRFLLTALAVLTPSQFSDPDSTKAAAELVIIGTT